ncbi:MAG TPA: HDOD domain-containing protein [Dissulfurispiraceae bacterium]
MEEKKNDFVAMVDRMPAFPRSVHRVLELASDIDCDPKELVEVISHDPVLILKILKLVNSAYFGLVQKITSVNHAVVYLGFNTVKNLALSTAAIGMLPRRNEAGFNMDAFLLHSLSTAIIARLFAKKMNISEKESFDYFLSGLLHDFGKVVFAHFMPHEFQRALQRAKEKEAHLYEAENEMLGINHTEVGSLLGEKWRLPANIVEALRGHHTRDGGLLLTEVVFASNQISKALKIGDSGEHIVEELPGKITGTFGTAIEGIVDSLGDVKAELEKAMVFVSL